MTEDNVHYDDKSTRGLQLMWGEGFMAPGGTEEVCLIFEGLEVSEVVGPICETGDYLAKDRLLPPVNRGDLLAVFSAGAYGMVMASHYNAMPNPPEVLVGGDAFVTIRRRETYEDLIAAERI